MPAARASPPIEAGPASPGAVGRALSAAASAASLAVFTSWAWRLLVRRNSPTPAGFGRVADLGALGPLPGEAAVVGIAVVLLLVLLVRRRALARPAAAAATAGLCLGAISASMIAPFGYYAVLGGAGLALAVLVGGQLPAGPQAFGPRGDRRTAAALWLGVAAVMTVFAVHRHASYGSGSWDMGCMVHNFYRASRFLDSISTVLGDVDFLGDHFMIGIYLYAPLTWLEPSGYGLLVIQSVNVAAAAPSIYLIARGRGWAPPSAAALGLATGLSFGMQSAAYFDSHEITVGIGFLAWGLYALESGRLRAATALFAVFALFKESLGAYVLALGLLALWRAAVGTDPDAPVAVERRRWLRYGLAWIVGGAVWFVLVNRVFMPALIARGRPPEPHETFADFGPTIFAAVLGILSSPIKAVAAMFVPGDKVQSQIVTLAGVGGLALAAPEILIPGAPLLAERFLSSKHTMWEMGYHYAAPLSLYAGWAAAIGGPRVHRALRFVLGGPSGLGDRAAPILAVYLIAMGLLVGAAGYRHPANFLVWEHGYFSTPERRAHHDAAIRRLRGLDRGARLAAQNRLLPHLADRPVIYRLGDWSKADYVLLSVGENAWPWDDGYPARLVQTLGRSPEWALVHAEGGTAIFARRTVSDWPVVPPTPELGLAVAPVRALPPSPPPPNGGVVPPGPAPIGPVRIDRPAADR